MAACRVPSLHIGSWYCRSVAATLRHAVLAGDATCVVGGWVSPLTHDLSADCAIDVPVEPDPTALTLQWLTGSSGTSRALWLGSGTWRDGSPVPTPRPARTVLTGQPAVLTADPARLYHRCLTLQTSPSSPVFRASRCLRETGRCATTVPLPARSPDGPMSQSQLVATLVQESPTGSRTVLTDGRAAVPAGVWTTEITFGSAHRRPPADHRMRLELTTSRYPRHPRPLAPGRAHPRPPSSCAPPSPRTR
ncbi:hypothetical protein [Salinispora arenicola]|uniref:hypothetical protein n=1 Tax=Salinispora arenicola TaxID=168697 RepID=UPI0027DE8475|nr:hypothetical protein [Salinispora arenicola]